MLDRRYALRRQLGSGAFSVVHLAVQRASQEHVAIKLAAPSPEAEAEAQLLADLEPHNHIIRRIDSFSDVVRQKFVLVLQFADRGDLMMSFWFKSSDRINEVICLEG